MPRKSSINKISPKKDFYYWLPLITAIVVNLFWGMFGLMFSVLMAAGSLAGAFYYPETYAAYIPLAPLPLLLVVPITLFVVISRYKKGIVCTSESFVGINISHLFFLLLSFLAVAFIFPSGLEGVCKSAYLSLMALMWFASLILVGFSTYLGIFQGKR